MYTGSLAQVRLRLGDNGDTNESTCVAWREEVDSLIESQEYPGKTSQIPLLHYLYG